MRPNKIKKKKFIEEYKKERSCIICGEKDYRCLEFHHRDELNNVKEKRISTYANSGYSIKRILKEIEKCDLVCANCHRRIHYKLIE